MMHLLYVLVRGNAASVCVCVLQMGKSVCLANDANCQDINLPVNQRGCHGAAQNVAAVEANVAA